MTDFNLFEWMIAEKIATNAFNASAILNGVKAFQVESTEEKKARVLLYRKWRTKTDRKNQLPTWQAFELAISGIDPDDVPARQIEMEIDDRRNHYPLRGEVMPYRPAYGTKPDKNHRIPVEYLRDRCGGFSTRKDGKTVAYTANYQGYKIILFDLSKFGGVLTDWLIQCADNNRFFWLESKTMEAFRLKDHDKTDGEKWLDEMVTNFRFCVEDLDMEGILAELIK